MSLAGLSTTELPAAKAGPTLWQTRLSGKLKGVIAATTPQGTRSVKPSRPAPPGALSSGRTSPDNRLASSAERSSVSAARETSKRPSARVFPSSELSVCPSSGVRWRIKSAAFEHLVAVVAAGAAHDLGSLDGAVQCRFDIGGIGLGHAVDHRAVEGIVDRDGRGLLDPEP